MVTIEDDNIYILFKKKMNLFLRIYVYIELIIKEKCFMIFIFL